MSRFCGRVGFAITREDCENLGVWEEHIDERTYYGDVNRNVRRLASSDKVNSDIDISNEISIVADPYANENFHAIRYVTWMGNKWRVSNVEVLYPRLILTIGGLYNA